MGNQRKVRSWRECENLVDSIVNGLEGVVAYDVSLKTTDVEYDHEALVVVGVQTAEKDYLDFELGTEWLSTAPIDAIEMEIKSLIKDQDERGRFTWNKPRSPNNGNATSIGAS